MNGKVLILLSVVLRFGFTLLLAPPLRNENDATPPGCLRGLAG